MPETTHIDPSPTTPTDSPNPNHPHLFPVYDPNPRCSICKSPHRLDIDAALFHSSSAIRSLANRFPNHSFSAIQRHKANCWPARDLPRGSVIHAAPEKTATPIAVVDAAQIARKNARLETLQRVWDGIKRIMDERAAAYAHIPGGSSGLLAIKIVSVRVGVGKNTRNEVHQVAEFDSKLVERIIDLHAATAKETGEALEQAGKVQTLVTGDNPCIMVLGAGAPRPIESAEARHRVQDTGRRKPVEVPDESVPAPVSASMMDIETILEARERALSGLSGGVVEDAGQAGEGVAGDDELEVHEAGVDDPPPMP